MSVGTGSYSVERIFTLSAGDCTALSLCPLSAAFADT